MTRFSSVDWVAMILAAIGAINWGLIGLFGLNLVTAIFGGVPLLVTIVYLLVGLAGLWLIAMLVRASSEQPRPSAMR